MPVPSPFHSRTSALCTSHRWKDWAGYHAVCSYDTCHEPEYHAFRHAVGLLDVSPLFKYSVTGPDAGAFLAWVTSRDIRKLGPDRVTYVCLCDHEGKIIDDGTVTRVGETSFRVTTGGPSLHWFLDLARGFDVEVGDVSGDIAALAVQGPRSRGVLSDCSDASLDDLRFFGATTARLAGVEVGISRTGYTGDLGYEVWMPTGDALAVWDAIFEAGESHGLLPCGLDALDVTRVEAGFVLQDVDYHSASRTPLESRKSSPFEMGLGWTVDLDRESFVGREALLRDASEGTPWKFVGLVVDWDELEALYNNVGLPPQVSSSAWRTSVPVFDGARQVGYATSGAWSPVLKMNLALATVETPFSTVGTRLSIEHTVEHHRHQVMATVTARPFLDPEHKRT